MINAAAFIEHLRHLGYVQYAGVPCSFLKPFINYVIDDPTLDYIGAASEGEAVGITLGASLAGRKTVTLCQNSGLGNMVNPLTSLNDPFRVPTLIITTWRGQPGIPDEPQHEQMGRLTPALLDTLEIPWLPFPTEESEIASVMAEAEASMARRERPFALIMAKDSVAPCKLRRRIDPPRLHARPQGGFTLDPSRRLTRTEALNLILHHLNGHEAIIATTGKTGRELFTLADRPNHLYVVGGMGTASAIGLGVAHSLPQQPVVVIDGDGAALMKLGGLATIGFQQPRNLLHIILDNESHDSTGGQQTASGITRFAEIAAAANYRNAASADDPDAIASLLHTLRDAPGPTLLHFKIQRGSPAELGRPTVKPHEVRDRFQSFLKEPNSNPSPPPPKSTWAHTTPMPSAVPPDKRLFTPGPLTTSPTVKEAMLHDASSRDEDFIHLVQLIRARLLDLAGVGANTGYEAVPMQGSGTFAVEAVLSTVIPPQGKLLVLANGAYGERMLEMARRHRIPHTALRWDENTPVSPQPTRQALADDPAISHVAVVHCETTSGILNPVDDIGRVVCDAGRQYIVDAMSSFGVLPVDMSRVDYLVSSANKCIEGVPGFGFVLAKRSSLEAARGGARTLSLDLYDQWRGLETNGQFRFTPPTHAMLAFARALEELDTEGGPKGRLARYRENQQTLAQGMVGLGFRLYLDPSVQSPIITTFHQPRDPRFDFTDFYRQLAQRGLVIYPGKLTRESCFRIGSIGRLDTRDMRALLDAVREVLTAMGLPSPLQT